MSCLYILEINPLSVVSFAIFSHSEGCLFTLLIVSFAVQKLFKFNRVPLVYFWFYFHYSRRWVRGSCFMSSSVLPMFSSKSFIVSGLIFRSLTHFEFIFVYGVRKCSFFIFLKIFIFTLFYFIILYWFCHTLT